MSDSDNTIPDGFRVIPGYPRYAIDETGTILSICEKGFGASRPWGKARRITPIVNKTGYHRVKLSHAGHVKPVFVHVLVLTAFVGPCPDGMECRHIDGIRANNRLDNLAWGTAKENSADKALHGTGVKGEKHPRSKLTVDDILKIRERAADGETHISIAKDFHVSYQTIGSIIKRKAWKHVNAHASGLPINP